MGAGREVAVRCLPALTLLLRYGESFLIQTLVVDSSIALGPTVTSKRRAVIVSDASNIRVVPTAMSVRSEQVSLSLTAILQVALTCGSPRNFLGIPGRQIRPRLHTAAH